jgi:hypothetical protein
LSGCGDAFGDRDGVNSEIHSDATIERVWIYTRRPKWSELRDAVGGRDQASLDIHMEAMIERVWTSSWRPRSTELKDAL